MDELEDDDVGDSAVCEKDGPRSVREQHPSPEPVSQSPGIESADTTLATTTTTAIPSPAPIHPHARTTHPDARAIISINIRDANNYDTYFHCRLDSTYPLLTCFRLYTYSPPCICSARDVSAQPS